MVPKTARVCRLHRLEHSRPQSEAQATRAVGYRRGRRPRNNLNRSRRADLRLCQRRPTRRPREAQDRSRAGRETRSRIPNPPPHATHPKTPRHNHLPRRADPSVRRPRNTKNRHQRTNRRDHSPSDGGFRHPMQLQNLFSNNSATAYQPETKLPRYTYQFIPPPRGGNRRAA